jgi:hypothetical protein
MTYDELVTAVNDYVENSFPTDVINTMIKQSEQRIYNTVQLASLRKNVTGTATVGNKYLQCPTDFLSVYSIAVISDSEYLYLLNKDVNFIREAYPSTAVAFRGKPKHYAIFGPRSDNEDELSFILGPTPDLSYEIELHYFYLPVSIVDAPDQQTWLGDNFDSALLYGTLMEAATYTKAEQDMVKLYSDRYVQSIALLKNLGDGKQRADAYRDGQVRVPVS